MAGSVDDNQPVTLDPCGNLRPVNGVVRKDRRPQHQDLAPGGRPARVADCKLPNLRLDHCGGG
jgi:hypothetical protein